MNVAHYIDTLLHDHCGQPVEACRCIRTGLDVQRAHRDVQARHRVAVARALINRARRAA